MGDTVSVLLLRFRGMVLANRLKLIHALLILFAATNCLAKKPFLEDCDTDKSLSALLEMDSNWEVARESGTFSPIIGLKVFESKLWVSTYGADFFPVKAKSASNSILLESTQFLRPAPVKIENDPAELVRPYAADDIIFVIPLAPNYCDIRDKLQIDITNRIGENEESLTFVRR